MRAILFAFAPLVAAMRVSVGRPVADRLRCAMPPRMCAQDSDSAMDERIAKLEAQLAALKAAASAPEAAAPPPPPPPPPAPAYPKLPERDAIGVDGQRCALVLYAGDGIPKAQALLEAFEDEAAEFAACGCALVAIRKVVDGDSADTRKANEYAARFPSFNLVAGLEERAQLRGALPGLGGEWLLADSRALYADPVVVLLDPDGGMRTVVSHARLSASNVLGNTLRALHEAVPPRDPSAMSAAEAESVRQSLHEQNVQWAKVLEEDESLRQPTRGWFDSSGPSGASARQKRLSGVDAAALPEAVAQYLAEGAGEEEASEAPLYSKDGVQAPAWYAKAKRQAEERQEEERRLLGYSPSAPPGPLPLGPAGARLTPLTKALSAAAARVGVDVDASKALPADDAQAAGGAAAAAAEGAADGGAGAAATAAGGAQARGGGGSESALLRAEMLALGLSRSSTSQQSTRRLRLVRELEAAVGELEAEGFNDRSKLGELKEQLKASYANAPAEFVEEARRLDRFNQALPPMSLAEIVAEVAELADSGLSSLGESLKTGAKNVDWGSLNPGRSRGPREPGNKIDLGKPPADRADEDV